MQRFDYQTLSTLSLPLIPVLIPALVHFMLATLALTTAFAGSVIFSHLALLLVTIWAALDRKRWESVAAFIFVLSVSALGDMIVLGVFQFNDGPSGRFGTAMIIINLLGKPISFISSLLALYSRRDSFRFSLTRNQYDASGDSLHNRIRSEHSGSGESGGGEDEQRVMSCSGTHLEFSIMLYATNTLFRYLVSTQCCFLLQGGVLERGGRLSGAKDATANMLTTAVEFAATSQYLSDSKCH